MHFKMESGEWLKTFVEEEFCHVIQERALRGTMADSAAAESSKALGKRKVKDDKEFEPEDGAKDEESTLEEEEKLEQGDTKVCG